MKTMRNTFTYFLSVSICFALSVLTACTTTPTPKEVAEETGTYPRAEWHPATAILMHTPGFELFDGVIHPSAGLFENYFDVDAAAREHQAYMAKLKEQGIEVHTVIDLLRRAEPDSLRALAARALCYDGSRTTDTPEMIEAYRQSVLKQMTTDDLIRCILLQPTVELYPTENNTGYEARYLHKPVMNLYFTRDQSITTPRGHILCRMNSEQRAVEPDIIALCYRQLGEEPIFRISGDARLEGGDYIPAGTFAYLGCGMRTNQEAIDQMLAADVIGHDTLVVCRDSKFWQMQMHLDTYFNVIDHNLVTLVESRQNALPGAPEYVTVDVYARPAGGKEYQVVTSGMGLVEFLEQRDIEIIGIGESDELHYANNYLAIAPRHIVAVGGQSEALQQAFACHGVKVEWLSLENLIDGYGAAHCMTQVLRRLAQ